MSGEKLLGARMRTNNKLNPHLMLSPGIESGPHWWEASALTTVPSITDRGSYSNVGLPWNSELFSTPLCIEVLTFITDFNWTDLKSTLCNHFIVTLYTKLSC